MAEMKLFEMFTEHSSDYIYLDPELKALMADDDTH